MSKKFTMGSIKNLKPYALDFLVVVLGIMLSLWLNDRRQKSDAHKEEKQILQQVLDDLKADTAKLTENMEGLEDLAKSSLKLLKISRDSILFDYKQAYMDANSVITYIPFDPSKVGYSELSTQGKSGRVTDKRLLMDVMDLYENGYKRIGELTTTHREFLVNKVQTYISQKMPYINMRDSISETKKVMIADAILADEYKHLLFFDIVLKQNLLEGYKQLSEDQKKLIEEINKKLK